MTDPTALGGVSYGPYRVVVMARERADDMPAHPSNPFTPADHLGTVQRSSSTTTRGGESMRVLEASRTFDAPLEEVWDALTTPERIERWLSPISGDFVVGGRFDIENNASGDILTCDKPRLVQVTWEFGGDTSWVDAALSASGDGTSVALKHTAAPPQEWWDQFGAGATGIGWEMMLVGIALHLAAPDAPRLDPADPALAAPLYELMAASSAGWADAEIAAGGDPDQARAAAERTLAFYTGIDSPEA